jgi:DNA-binding response OmpR family regulator
MRVLWIPPADAIADFPVSEFNWNLTTVHSLDEAIAFIHKTEFQAILILIGRMAENGLKIVSGLARAKCSSPIIACMESNDTIDRIWALRHGAITCVQWPLSLDELELSVRAVARHKSGAHSNTIEARGVCLNIAAKQFTVGETVIPFTRREYQLLELLFLNQGRLITRDKIMNHLYDYDEEPEQKIIDVLICKIRKRIKSIVGPMDFVETVWGGGYRVPNCQSVAQ